LIQLYFSNRNLVGGDHTIKTPAVRGEGKFAYCGQGARGSSGANVHTFGAKNF